MGVGVVGVDALGAVDVGVAVGVLDDLEPVGAPVMETSDGGEAIVDDGAIEALNDDGETVKVEKELLGREDGASDAS